MPQSSPPLPKTDASKKPAVPSQEDSQKKLVELRAKLLANRPRSAASQRSSSGGNNNNKGALVQPRSMGQGLGIEKGVNGKVAARGGQNSNRAKVERSVILVREFWGVELDVLTSEVL